jgi:hypothetical protein
MAKWLQLQLSRGKIGEQSLVSEAALEQMHTPQIFTNDEEGRQRFGYEFSSYGLGWAVRSHKGQFLVEHDGMTDGFYTLTSFMPRHHVGVVVLSNADSYYSPVQSNLAPNVIAYTLYDRLLDLEPSDWNAALQAACDERAEMIRQYFEVQAAAGETVEAPAAHPLDAYAGEYSHPGYGVISVQKTGGGLRMVINDKLTLSLEHCCYDIFEAVFAEPVSQRQKISFQTDLQGKISQVVCGMEPRVKEIVFRRG